MSIIKALRAKLAKRGVSFLPMGTKEKTSSSYYTKANMGPFAIGDLIRDIDGDPAIQLMYLDPDTKIYKHLVIKKDLFNALFIKG